MYLGGIDIGSTGCKITVYDDQGNYVYRAYRDYPVERSAGEHEVDGAALWEKVQEVIADAAGKYPLRAIGISSFGESCVLLDEADQPLLPVMLYTDPRGVEECQELTEKVGREKIRRLTGVDPHSMYSLPKLMWIRKNRPDVWKQVRHILMMEDYVIYMLTGNAVIDYSLAARSMAFDISKLCWAQEMFAAAGVDSRLFSMPVVNGSAAGTVKPDMAEKLGLTEETLIIPVGHDQVAATIGSGVFDEETGVDGAGTVECIIPIYDGIPEGDTMYENGYAVVPYVVPGKYVTYAFSFTGGALVSWFINNLAKGELEESRRQGISVYELLEKDMKNDPTGILVLPHFAGAGTPYMDEGSKGAILGLTVEHTASDLYRAMMEGVVYEMMINQEKLMEAGIRPKRLLATGGGAASEVWMQMKADMLQIPVTSLENADAGAAASAIMAGVAAGVFADQKSAAAVFVKERKTYYPRQDMYEKYRKHYERYKKVYGAVRELV